MKRQFEKIVVLLLIATLGWFVFSLMNLSTDQGPGRGISRTKMDEATIATALKSYSLEYGALPSGDAGLIERILSGENINAKNPRKIQFLSYKRGAEHTNEMVDSWGTPYRIEFLQQTNPIIRSAGKNRLFGDQDDIVYDGSKQDFVNP